MKCLLATISIIIFFSSVNSTPIVSLSGKITDGNGTPINGARLNLKNFPRLVWKTDASGAIVGTKIVSLPAQGRNPLQIMVRNNIMIFKTTTITRHASISVLNSRGTRVSTTEFFNMAPGNQRIPLHKNACGVYFIRVSLDNQFTVCKMIAGSAKTGFSDSPTPAMPVPHVNQSRGSVSSYIDTLFVVANGFKHALIPLASYTQQNINCSLSVSNPWKPTGPLEHFKNMAKIKAKNYNFEMGQPNPYIWDEDSAVAEQPIHTVFFTYDFYIDTTEVTQADYDFLMKATYTSYQKPDWQTMYGLGNTFPTYSIEWGDAALYCNARSKRDGYDTVYKYTEILGVTGSLCVLSGLTQDLSKNGYRLPTESEWEYACRAGTATDFFWGKNYLPYPATPADTAEISGYAIWMVNSWDLGTDSVNYGTHRVATKKPNTYGIYDLSGNLSEYCNDYWTEPYPFGTVIDPIGGPDTTEFHPIRGGNWGNDPSRQRSANRYLATPNYPYFFIGFRTAKRAL